MKTKEELENYLRDKGPSFIYGYLVCYYKEVELFKETQLYQDLLNNMSSAGKARFEEKIKLLEKFAESNKNWNDKEYENWCDKHLETIVSNKELSAAAAKPGSSTYNRITANNDFYQTCVIHLKDRVSLTEDYGLPEGLVGTVIGYSIGKEVGKHFMEVEFRLVDEKDNLFEIQECLVPINFLKVEERWDSRKEKYTKKFNKNKKAFPNVKLLTLEGLHDNDDEDEYGYTRATEHEDLSTTETENPLVTGTEGPSTTETENPLPSETEGTITRTSKAKNWIKKLSTSLKTAIKGEKNSV